VSGRCHEWEKGFVNLSLRAKLLILGALVQAFTGYALVANSLRLVDAALAANGAGTATGMAAVREQILRQGALIAFVGLSAGMLLLFLFSGRIRRRLDLLNARSQRLAQGHFDEEVPEWGGDELQMFSRSLNTMSVALRERIRQLDDAAQRLRESEARFQTLFDTAPVPLAVTRSDGSITAVNRALTRIFGQAQADMLGKLPGMIDVWADSGERERVWSLHRRDGVVKGEIAKVRLQDGDIGAVAIWSSTLTLDGGPAIIWAMLDMTEELRAKHALEELNTSLESRVQLRSAELERANTDLSQALETLKRTQRDLISSEKMASLGSLVAGVAHELNTPIGNSLLAATSLSDRVEEFRAELAGGTLKRSALNNHLADATLACGLISSSLNKAASLIASFKQVAVDQTCDERRQFDLRHVLEDTLATFAPRLRRTGCAAAVRVDGALALNSYPGSLCQVINNLIANALLHAFDQRPSASIAIAAHETDAGEVAIVFSDDGVGMTDEVLHRVFDPFFTTRMGSGGTGLGMNIVYNIVTGVLGGQISVATELGHGTRVVIVIPKAAPLRESARRGGADTSGEPANPQQQLLS
jgi:PAS domain S-box-containing protein